MKIITTTHYNRPQCTSQMISYLEKCAGIENYTVIFCIEPGCSEVVELVEACPLRKEIHYNDRVLGLWENKKKVLSFGFDQTDFVIHLEDDLLLAQDALTFFEWANKTYQDQNEVFTVTAYNRIPKDQFMNTRCQHCGTPTSYYEVERRRHYTSWAWATWKNRWDEFKDEWNGHDTELELTFRKARFEAFPTLSRCQNIGYEIGVCGTKQLLDDLIKMGHEPIGLSRSRVTGELRWGDKFFYKGQLLQNEQGGEWIKLNETTAKSRYSAEIYKKRHHLSFWAEDIELPNYRGFFDLGHSRPTSHDETDRNHSNIDAKR